MPGKKTTLSFGGTRQIDEKTVWASLHAKGVIETREDLATQLTDTFDELEVSLRDLGRKSGFISIPGLASVALAVRAVAESGRPVKLLLPRATPTDRTSLQRLLAHLGFADLFERAANWQKLVRIVGEVPRPRVNESAEEASYVPFRWFDLTWFDVPSGGLDLFEVEPRVNHVAAQGLRDLLLARGFLENDAVDLFVRVMFLELGWNAVLHSQAAPGVGYGILGAHVQQPQPLSDAAGSRARGATLRFCIADGGLGIPHTLRPFYAASGKRYEEEYGCSTAAAILRRAIDPEATRRQMFPNELYRLTDRGLARVADAASVSEKLEFGSFSISSGPGRLRLTAQGVLVKPTLDEAYARAPIPGVTVSADLVLKRVSRMQSKSARRLRELSSPTIVTAAAVFHDEFRLRTIRPTALCVIDVGFSDIDVRVLEQLVPRAGQIFPKSVLLFVNVRTQLNQLRPLSALCRDFTRPLVIARDASEAAVFLPAVDTDARATVRSLVGEVAHEQLHGFSLVDMDPAVFTAVLRGANTHYLTRGFQKEGPDSGFFVGRIHLLSGTVVNQYFALTRNTSSESGLRRWATSCGAALTRILSDTDIRTVDITVLGMPGAIKHVLTDASKAQNLPDLAVYALMTYDVPTSEELESVLGDRSAVIFVTDVVSTASLLTEARRIVEKLGKRMLGVISLVDARANRTSDPIPGVRFESMGEVQINLAEQPELGEEYWVDPVSLVPTPRQIFGHNYDPRVGQTLDVLCDSTAVRCGHIVDGQRHMSTYIDVAQFINEKREWLVDRITSECQDRMEGRQWAEFRPAHILYPSGIARIDAVSTPEANNNVVSYRTGVTTYLPLLAEMWPGSQRVPVARAFDPAGRPRCARVLDRPETERSIGDDVVVADDCLWTGQSADQLVTLAATLGAKRVLVVTLLARLPPEDLEHWESVQTVTRNRTTADVCYTFPLVLPIPQYGNDECPYEITYNRLRRSSKLTALEDEEHRACEQLKRRPPHGSLRRSKEFTSTWLRLRVYSELAGVDENALRLLSSAIRAADSPDARLALLTLFLGEWNILGRARLRQTIRPLLRDLASATMSDDAARTETVIAACSLLRSTYPDHFVESLPAVATRAAKEVDLLGRLVFQISSLPTHLRGHRHVTHFLRRITTHTEVPDLGTDEQLASVERLAGLLTTCEQLQLPTLVTAPSTLSARAATAALRDLLTADARLTHEAWPWLEIIATSDNPSSYKAQTLRSLYDEWTRSHLPIITERVVPLVASLESQLLLALGRSSRLASPDTDYFTDVTSPNNGFVADISAFGFALKRLADHPGGTAFLRILKTSAARLTEMAFAKKSVLVAALSEMHGPTVRQFVDGLRAQIEATVVGFDGLIVRVERHDTSEFDDRNVFAPADVAHTAGAAIVDNLRRYAFPLHAAKRSTPEVLIAVSPSDDSEQGVSIRVFDNGRPLAPTSRPSEASRRTSADIAYFQGQLHAPASNDEPWSVVQQVDLMLA